ncbi:MAG: lipase [Gordonia sp.]|uniref:Alpha/beta fold hydrolase n=1 Tax=Gordonia rubripertincta TaxID=36822 RepID=A0ABT4MS34_GORRU|nr:alpha/beta fold hydrolase [Gordonia rubripertincta]MBA4023796.1 lipase [Gordonia sp. (in: high G+C Gram-positive bacteria)]MCZ4549815.1 alpha/beta fold hydrolase [Gordonia rubripertincta]
MRQARAVGVVIASILLCVGTVLGTGAAAAKDPLPVTYNFFAGIPNELANPGGSLPGANDWNCKPSPEHPEPVVLVHGTGGGAQTNWGTYVPLLANNGYCVYTLNYGTIPGAPWPISAIGGFGPIEKSAAELSAFVDRVRKSTGAKKVDIVGHSQGTLMPTYWIKFLGGADKVDKYISLAPLWNGTNVAAAGELTAYAKALGIDQLQQDTIGMLCGACLQMAKGSDMMKRLQAGGILDPDITYTNIMTRFDELIVPYTSGSLRAANSTNIVVQDGCSQDYSEHAGVAGSRRAATFVLNALDPEHPRAVPCELALPFTG